MSRRVAGLLVETLRAAAIRAYIIERANEERTANK
jgi:hypothetical protein